MVRILLSVTGLSEFTVGNVSQLYDDAVRIPDNLYCIGHLAGRRLGIDHVHGGSGECKQGFKGSGSA